MENGHAMEVARIENGFVTEAEYLMEGDWSCYRSGHKWRENGHVTEMVTNGGRIVILWRWSV